MKIHLKGLGYTSSSIEPDEQNVWCELGGTDGVNKLNLLTTENKTEVTCKRCINYLNLKEK